MKRFVFLLLLAAAVVGAAAPESDPGVKSAEVQLDKAYISFRIGVTQSLPEKRFTDLMELFDKYKGVTDEISFFTSETHPPIPLEVFQQRVKILAERMKTARTRGYSAGINILSTIGHHEENLENSLQGNYTPATDIQGGICRGSFCPNGENFRQYVLAIYTAAVQADPDFIWIDDDVRLIGHLPIQLMCFCDNCLAIFEKETGQKYTRETLKKAADEGPLEEKLKLREAWLQHNRNTIANLFTFIEGVVRRNRPQTELGFMTGERFAEGYDFDRWAAILAGANYRQVRWRPGGGFYDDLDMRGLVGKSHEIGRQVSLLPNDVINIQSEIENFPYQRLKKAAAVVVLEACSHIAAGCTGAAFNVLSMYDEPLDEFEPLVARLQQARPFFDLMARSFGRSRPIGIFSFWNKDSFATSNLSSGSWFSGGISVGGNELFDIGLPVCYAAQNADVTILTSGMIYALSAKEIEDILSRGVYLDAETLRELNTKGFGELTGFDVGRSDTMDRIEQFTSHPLNGPFAGRERDNRQSFVWWNYPAYTLIPTSEKSQSLCRLIDYADREIAPCTMGIFENRLGGRICVAGYYPWTFLQNLSKGCQLKSVFRWLSKDLLPGYIASFHKINLWIRSRGDGKTVIAMTNASYDPADNVVLMLRTTEKNLTVYDMQCRPTVIQSARTDGPYQKFIIPHIDPWQMRLITTSNI
jgi:hypothetical protein